MKEIMEALKKSGTIDRFVKRNARSIEEVRKIGNDPDWKPAPKVLQVAAGIALAVELAENEKLREAFDEFATGLAMDKVTKELVKIAMEG